MINTASKLELHYYFIDRSHSMSASVRHECEREVLLVIKQLSTILEFSVDIESEALQEGGLKNLWKLLGKNGAQITLLLAIITVILSRVPVENKELVNLQIENLKLDNEIKQNELKKIKQELKNDSAVSEELVQRVVEKLENDYKLLWHRSNFYKKVNQYQKIERISTRLLNENNEPADEERSVSRHEFPLLVIHSDKVAPFVDENALIEIISPVLTGGNFHWRGRYQSVILSFEMKDERFKKSVLQKKVEFVNGIGIRCVLHQSRKIDELGVIQIVNSQVVNVIELVENSHLLSNEKNSTEAQNSNSGQFPNNQMKLFN